MIIYQQVMFDLEQYPNPEPKKRILEPVYRSATLPDSTRFAGAGTGTNSALPSAEM